MIVKMSNLNNSLTIGLV